MTINNIDVQTGNPGLASSHLHCFGGVTVGERRGVFSASSARAISTLDYDIRRKEQVASTLRATAVL